MIPQLRTADGSWFVKKDSNNDKDNNNDNNNNNNNNNNNCSRKKYSVVKEGLIKFIIFSKI